jgi:putative nucleotidyltransferase with HDIG domain
MAKMIVHDYETYENAMKVTWWTLAFISENPEILTYCQKDEISDAEQISETLRSCGVCALLHDIGKAYVPQEVINKNGPLTEIEWEIMKRHPLSGLAMLLDSELPAFVKKAIVQHHEDFDGGGYPMNLEGTNITVLARVLRIMDVFDAMTSRRPYKDPLSPMKVIQIMIGTPSHPEDNAEPAQDPRDRGMGRCFDHELLVKFIIFIWNVKLDQEIDWEFRAER